MNDTDLPLDTDTRSQTSDAERSDIVRVAVPGFAALYAAALKLPHELLENDLDACADRIEAPALEVQFL